METIYSWKSKILASYSSDSVLVQEGRRILNIFLEDLLSVSQVELFLLEQDYLLSQKIVDQLLDYWKRFLAKEPVEYILGYANFFNLKLHVDSSVLIPRQ